MTEADPCVVTKGKRVIFVEIASLEKQPTGLEKIEEMTIFDEGSDPKLGRITTKTPVAQALLGHKLGERTTIRLSSGDWYAMILKIEGCSKEAEGLPESLRTKVYAETSLA